MHLSQTCSHAGSTKQPASPFGSCFSRFEPGCPKTSGIAMACSRTWLHPASRGPLLTAGGRCSPDQAAAAAPRPAPAQPPRQPAHAASCDARLHSTPSPSHGMGPDPLPKTFSNLKAAFKVYLDCKLRHMKEQGPAGQHAAHLPGDVRSIHAVVHCCCCCAAVAEDLLGQAAESLAALCLPCCCSCSHLRQSRNS